MTTSKWEKIELMVPDSISTFGVCFYFNCSFHKVIDPSSQDLLLSDANPTYLPTYNLALSLSLSSSLYIITQIATSVNGFPFPGRLAPLTFLLLACDPGAKIETSCSSSVTSAVTNFKWHLVRERLEFIIMAVVHRVMEFVLLALALVSKVTGLNPTFWWPTFPDGGAYCLSWRLAVEANNLRAWRTVPPQCLFYVEKYMTEGQYEKDLNLVIDQIRTYVNQIVPSDDSLDAWILDIDDTCISNVGYYKEKKYGCDPYDPVGFRTWALKGACPAIRSVLGLFRDLIGRGFKVILITGRDEQTLGRATLDNLQTQGFVGYEQLIMRTEAYKGRSAVLFKSEIRKKLVAEGYRIWGNVGDQWSDLQGEVSGNRTFKLPNPMYYVP